MTGRAKGRLLLAVLALLVGGTVSLLASSARARVRWYSWRMRAGDPEVAARARFKLFELDRPAIDEVLPELVARELGARLRPGERVEIATVASKDASAVPVVTFASRWETWQYEPGDPTSVLLAKRARSHALVLVLTGPSRLGSVSIEVIPIAIPLDDDLAPEILTAVRAELGDRAP
jgi:hypothetical protein